MAIKAALREERLREACERSQRLERARIDVVVAEFGGDVDAMAREILSWRRHVRQLEEVVAKVRTGEPFVVMGAEPHWKPGRARR